MTHARLRRLTRAESAVSPSVEILPVEGAGTTVADAGELAGEIASSFRQTVSDYIEYFKLPHGEAVARTCQRNPESEKQELSGPPDEVTWDGLEALYRSDPDLALRRWEEVKQAARKERQSGHRTARALEGHGHSCWGRAQFLAVRADLIEAWQPRNAQEQHLIDQMARYQTLMEWWQETLTAYAVLAGISRKRRAKVGQPPEPPRLSESEVVEGSAAMVERFHRLYLRTLRALQDLRRATPRVVIRRATQVNVANQQVNVTQ